MNWWTLRKLFRQTFRLVGANKFLFGYLIFFVAMAFVIHIIEPSISGMKDSFWYCFEVATTVGFGDIAAISFFGRILTIILSIYSIAALAVFTAVVTSFFMDVSKIQANKSAKKFLHDLENLPDLSKEELRDLSERIKKYHEKI